MKYFFSVSKEEQLKRFESRQTDPLKQYKISPVDMQAQDLWNQYTIRKFQMLSETNRTLSPWTIIRSNNKKKARINCIKHILSTVKYQDKISKKHLSPDPDIVISGIDELKFMEDNLMSSCPLPGWLKEVLYAIRGMTTLNAYLSPVAVHFYRSRRISRW